MGLWKEAELAWELSKLPGPRDANPVWAPLHLPSRSAYIPLVHSGVPPLSLGVRVPYQRPADKIDFKIKTVTRDKEGHYIMIKGSIQKEYITIINVYAPNIGALQCIRQMLTTMKGKINSNTIMVGDFNTPLTPMDRSSKQKINKETQALNDTIDQIDLIVTYRTFHPEVAEYTFFSSAHRTFSRIDYILDHKSNLVKFKKIEIISSIFSDHNAIRLEINYRKKTVKNTNTWRLNSTLQNKQEITE